MKTGKGISYLNGGSARDGCAAVAAVARLAVVKTACQPRYLRLV